MCPVDIRPTKENEEKKTRNGWTVAIANSYQMAKKPPFPGMICIFFSCTHLIIISTKTCSAWGFSYDCTRINSAGRCRMVFEVPYGILSVTVTNVYELPISTELDLTLTTQRRKSEEQSRWGIPSSFIYISCVFIQNWRHPDWWNAFSSMAFKECLNFKTVCLHGYRWPFI